MKAARGVELDSTLLQPAVPSISGASGSLGLGIGGRSLDVDILWGE